MAIRSVGSLELWWDGIVVVECQVPFCGGGGGGLDLVTSGSFRSAPSDGWGETVLSPGLEL